MTEWKKGSYLMRATSPKSFGFNETKERDDGGGKLPTIGIRLTFVSGPHEGLTVVRWLNFTDKTWKRSIDELKLLGWDGKCHPRDMTLDPSREVLAELTVERDNDGEPRAKVGFLNAVGVHTERPLPPNVLEEFGSWLVERAAEGA